MSEDYHSSKIFDPNLANFEKKLHMSAFFLPKVTNRSGKKRFWALNVGMAGEKGDEKLKQYA